MLNNSQNVLHLYATLNYLFIFFIGQEIYKQFLFRLLWAFSVELIYIR